MKVGIMLSDEKLYFPKSYEELVTSKKGIKLGQNTVYIVGIINDDKDNLFESARKTGVFGSEKLKKYFSDTYVDKSRSIYVKGFIDSAVLRCDKESILNRMSIMNSIPSSWIIVLLINFSFNVILSFVYTLIFLK